MPHKYIHEFFTCRPKELSTMKLILIYMKKSKLIRINLAKIYFYFTSRPIKKNEYTNFIHNVHL